MEIAPTQNSNKIDSLNYSNTPKRIEFNSILLNKNYNLCVKNLNFNYMYTWLDNVRCFILRVKS